MIPKTKKKKTTNYAVRQKEKLANPKRKQTNLFLSNQEKKI